jgi:cyclophilin family peptidyl-prolyl cis-trans isomerase
MRAVEALGRIGSHSVASEIAGRLESFHFRGTPFERAYLESSITALVRLGNPSAWGVIEKLAGIDHPEIKKRAADALAFYGSIADEPNMQRAIASLVESTGLTDIEEATDPSGISITNTFCRILAALRKNRTIARLETNQGNIEIELFREDAAVTVANFVLMAAGGYYDGMEFVRTVPQYPIVGESLQTRTRRIHAIPGEVNMRPFERGRVGMAQSGGNSLAGSFFITLEPQPYLDGINTCFGRVISGMQIADRIVSGDRIHRVIINETISFHDYQEY